MIELPPTRQMRRPGLINPSAIKKNEEKFLLSLSAIESFLEEADRSIKLITIKSGGALLDEIKNSLRLAENNLLEMEAKKSEVNEKFLADLGGERFFAEIAVVVNESKRKRIANEIVKFVLNLRRKGEVVLKDLEKVAYVAELEKIDFSLFDDPLMRPFFSAYRAIFLSLKNNLRLIKMNHWDNKDIIKILNEGLKDCSIAVNAYRKILNEEPRKREFLDPYIQNVRKVIVTIRNLLPFEGNVNKARNLFIKHCGIEDFLHNTLPKLKSVLQKALNISN